MKYSLLDLTQSVLSSMDGETINGISDTVESMQVATIIRTVYFDMLNRANLPEHKSLFQLIASGSSDKPTLMTVPSTVSSVNSVRYDKRLVTDTSPQISEVIPLSVEQFLEMTLSFDTTESEVGSFSNTVDGSAITFYYKNDRAPSYYTSFDDNTLIFDSYDSAVDTTLQGSKTLCWGKRVIPWTMSDSFTPDLDEPQFALLLNESKALAWAELKQSVHNKAEQNARRGWTQTQKNKYAVPLQTDFQKLPSFGRI